jgi:hypothetical protein
MASNLREKQNRELIGFFTFHDLKHKGEHLSTKTVALNYL